MAIGPEDLLTPQGELEQPWFPGQDQGQLIERLSGYIDEGAKRSSDDGAIKAWAYFKAYTAIYMRMSANPNFVSLPDQGTASFGKEQAGRFKTKAEEWKAVFVSLTNTVVTDKSSSAVQNKFTW